MSLQHWMAGQGLTPVLAGWASPATRTSKSLACESSSFGRQQVWHLSASQAACCAWPDLSPADRSQDRCPTAAGDLTPVAFSLRRSLYNVGLQGTVPEGVALPASLEFLNLGNNELVALPQDWDLQLPAGMKRVELFNNSLSGGPTKLMPCIFACQLADPSEMPVGND